MVDDLPEPDPLPLHEACVALMKHEGLPPDVNRVLREAARFTARAVDEAGRGAVWREADLAPLFEAIDVHDRVQARFGTGAGAVHKVLAAVRALRRSSLLVVDGPIDDIENGGAHPLIWHYDGAEWVAVLRDKVESIRNRVRHVDDPPEILVRELAELADLVRGAEPSSSNSVGLGGDS